MPIIEGFVPHWAMAFLRVAAYVPAGAAALGLGLAAAVFRPRPGGPPFDFAVCADRRGPVPTDLGVPVLAGHGPVLLARARTQRLNRAEELLETTTLTTQRIAELTGYGSAAVLREQFTARRGVPPRDYRRSFARTP
jgi:hypothetical protein